MKVLTPPYTNLDRHSPRVFLGGGIGGCPDWQQYFIEQIQDNEPDNEFTIINPRWEYKWTSLQQIKWEHDMLAQSSSIVMWFARGGQNRIVFYELGKWINSNNEVKAWVGCDPEFDRKDDVVIQTHLARPDLTVYSDLDHIIKAVRGNIDNN